MKESTKTEEVKIVEITKESLSNLSEGYFRVPISKDPISKDQTEEISKHLKMREHWGVPRPFGVKFGASLIEEDFLYLWVKESVTVLYLATKYKPNALQLTINKYPELQIMICTIRRDKQEEILGEISGFLGCTITRDNQSKTLGQISSFLKGEIS